MWLLWTATQHAIVSVIQKMELQKYSFYGKKKSDLFLS